MNHWLRFRVIAQGFTICAIVGGGYFMNGQKQKQAAEEVAAERLEAERLKEREGFEERMKAAEEAHAMEEQAKASFTDGRGATKSSGWGFLGFGGNATAKPTPPDATSGPVASVSVAPDVPSSSVPSPPTISSEKPSSGWTSWFGGKGSGSSST